MTARKGGLYIFVAALLWSSGGLFIKEVTLGAWGVSFWRSAFAALTLYAIYWALFRKSREAAALPQQWLTKRVMLIAVIYAALLILFVTATKLTTSANAIFLQYTAPIYVLFAEPLFSKAKIKRRDFLAVGFSVAAMALFFVGKIDVEHVWGNIAALASGVAFAAFAVLLKHLGGGEVVRWRSVIVGHILIAITAYASIAVTGAELMPHGGDMGRLLFLGVIQIGVAYAVFTIGLNSVRAIDATLICMVEPVLNPVWVYLGIGERPNNFALLGGAMILIIVLIRTITTTREEALEVIETHG